MDIPKDKLICGRCYLFVDKLFDAPCIEKPEDRIGEPIGQYHCPDCGTMLIAGIKHFTICKECLKELENFK